jgi:peptide/nickel transport system substrate-binding protein
MRGTGGLRFAFSLGANLHGGQPMRRRHFITGATTATVSLSRPVRAAAPTDRALRYVPPFGLTSLDPILGIPTSTHAYMVYDTLYGVDTAFVPHPQMAEGHVIDNEGRRWTIKLREGLVFHDGEKVRAQDAVTSVGRWMKRNTFGQKLESLTEELSALDDRSIVFRLKKPFPLLPAALANPANPSFVLPERLARTDPFKPIQDATGSGPFRFKADEFNSGSFAAYERSAAYLPITSGEPSLTAGPKVVHFDRVEWQAIPDPATAAAALQKAEVDWYAGPTPEQIEAFRRSSGIKILPRDFAGSGGILRFNQLHPPFDNKALRQALLPAIDQADFMRAIVGDDTSVFQIDTGVFPPTLPSATTAGLEPLSGPRSLDRARALMKEAGYSNQPMRLLMGTDLPTNNALGAVAADLFRRLGFNMDLATSDWATVLRRRTSQEPLERGGWSVFLTTTPAIDLADPAVNVAIRGNGKAAYPGWPTSPRLEQLRDAWFDAPDDTTRKAICADIQRTVMEEVPYIPLGFYVPRMAMRRYLADQVVGFPVFWGVRRV